MTDRMNDFYKSAAPVLPLPFLIKVQQGLVPGYSLVSKFAEAPSLLAASVRTDIWDYPGELLYTYSSTAAIDSIASSDNSDTAIIVIQGLDENWELITQTKALTGQTRAALDTPLIRVFRAFNGNGVATAGNVYVYEETTLSAGVPVDTTKVRAYISIFEQQTLMGVYTVPLGKTAYFLGLSASMSKPTATSTAVMTGSVRPFGGVFRTQIRFALMSVGSSYVTVPSNAFSAFPEKSDFIAYTEVSANSTGVSVTFDLLLIDNNVL